MGISKGVLRVKGAQTKTLLILKPKYVEIYSKFNRTLPRRLILKPRIVPGYTSLLGALNGPLQHE